MDHSERLLFTREDFTQFALGAEPRLRRALVASRGIDGAGDGAAEALAYAWEHWEQVSAMENPVGYLYRVAQSRTRPKRTPMLPSTRQAGLPEVEPGLVPALLDLSPPQRSCVWLVHACGWTYRETAEALGLSVTAVGTHLSRGMEALRRTLGVES